MELPNKPKKVETEMEMYLEVASDLIANCPPLLHFAGMMGVHASTDPDSQDPVGMFSYAFTLGFAKALHDINKGYINLSVIIQDKGEINETESNQKNDLSEIRRNKAAGDGQADNMAGGE